MANANLIIDTITGATKNITPDQFKTANGIQAIDAFLTQLITGGLTDPGNVVFEGDSLTTDVSPTSGDGNDWPQQFAARPFFQGTYTNVATAGNTIANIISQYASQVEPLSPSVTGIPATLFIWSGANDLPTTTAAAFMTSLRSYWASAKADGFRVVAFTVTPRDTGGSNNAAVEAVRKSINTQIWNDLGTLYDNLIDVAQMFPDPNNTDNYSDALHLTASANLRIAAAVQYILQNQMFQSGADVNGQKIYNPNIIGGTGAFTTNLSLRKANAVITANSTGASDAGFFARPELVAGSRQVGFSAESGTADALIVVYNGTSFLNMLRCVNSNSNVVVGFGDLVINTAGKTLQVKGGTNAKAGTFTLVAGAATVANTAITANSVIHATLKTLGGTQSNWLKITPTASTGFAVVGENVLDTGVYNYVVSEVLP